MNDTFEPLFAHGGGGQSRTQSAAIGLMLAGSLSVMLWLGLVQATRWAAALL